MSCLTRRDLCRGAGALALAGSARHALAQHEFPPPVPAPAIYPFATRSPVALIKGEDRRRNIYEALMAVDREIRPQLRRKSHVVIKVNNVSTSVQLAATHTDALRGILDYIAPRFKGPVVIAESAVYDTLEAFETFRYAEVISEYRPRRISLVDLNREGKYETFSIVDANIRPTPVRLAARLLDPDAFVISAAILKAHNAVVATLSVKNIVMGAPLHSLPETGQWHDKEVYHARFPRPADAPGGARSRGGGWNPHAMNYSMLITARRLMPNWGVAVIDGFEGMEGNGPVRGDPVPMRIALASPDFIAADRVGLETMGIPGHAVGYLQYAGQLGLGQYDLEKIEVRGEQPASVQRRFRLNDNIEQQFRWLNDMIPQA